MFICRCAAIYNQEASGVIQMYIAKYKIIIYALYSLHLPGHWDCFYNAIQYSRLDVTTSRVWQQILQLIIEVYTW